MVDDELIQRLNARIRIAPSTDCQQHPPIVARPPLLPEELEDFERESGIRLPKILRRIYAEVGDGGFGPDWGINPLRGTSEMSVEVWDHLERQEWEQGPPAGWPDPLIRICEIGCNAYYGIDCTTDEGNVIIVDPLQGTEDPVTWLKPLNKSVGDWLGEWVEKPVPPLKS